MKRKIIIAAVVIAIIVGGVIALERYYDYKNYHWADDMLEQSQQLNELTAGNDELSEIIATCDIEKRKALLRSYADEHNIKIKELSDDKLKKYKTKSDKLQEDIYYLDRQIEKVGRADPSFDELAEKRQQLVVEKTEYDVLIAYNEY